MVSEMIELVAIAIYDAAPFYRMGTETKIAWANLSKVDKESFRASARAAIEAMRAPTDEMVAAGIQEVPGSANSHDPFFRRDRARRIWAAMHGEALE